MVGMMPLFAPCTADPASGRPRRRKRAFLRQSLLCCEPHTIPARWCACITDRGVGETTGGTGEMKNAESA